MRQSELQPVPAKTTTKKKYSEQLTSTYWLTRLYAQCVCGIDKNQKDRNKERERVSVCLCVCV